MSPALLLAATLAAAAASPGVGPATGVVTYRVGGSVYVDVGALDGLAAGDTLEVLHDGRARARLVAREVAPRRAVCDTLAGGGGFAVGDGARFRPRLVRTPAAADTVVAPGVGVPAAEPAAPVVPAEPRRRTARRLRGRAGLSSWSVSPGRERAFVEPAADLWLDARGLANGAVDAVLDVRGRSIAPVAGSAVARESFGARVYRATLNWHDADSRHVLSMGRQVAPGFASVSLFDGIVARTAGRRFGGGLLFGAQPGVEHLEPSFDLLQAGGFLEAHSGPGRVARWSATLGGVTSWREGASNRDFLFASGSWQAHGMALLLAQEVDIANGWRRSLLPDRLTLTSTFASARVDVSPLVQARAGYDGRRAIPLYRDRATPETEFDDARREGAWLGASVRPRRSLRVDADVRRRFGADDVRMTTWNGGVDWSPAGRWPLRLRARAARANGASLRTTLVSGGVECEVVHGVTIGAGGGSRSTTDAVAGFDERTPWWSAEAAWALARTWSLSASFEHENGDPAADLGRFGAAYRF